MRKRRKLLVFLLAVLLAGVFWWVLSRDREPRYAGRTLSSWLADYSQIGEAGTDEDRRRGAVQAIRDIGSNAIPHLLRSMSYTQPGWKKITVEKSRKLAYWAAVNLPPNVSSFVLGLTPAALISDNGLKRAQEAVLGLGALGPAAEPALPRLMELALDNADPIRSDRAIRALFTIQPFPKPAIVQLLRNGPAQEKTLTYIGPRSQIGDLLPSLTNCLHQGRGDVPQLAALLIANLATSDPESTLPILTNAVASPRPEVRKAVLHSTSNVLGREAARPLAPSLRRLLTDPDLAVRRAATNWFRSKAPGVLSPP